MSRRSSHNHSPTPSRRRLERQIHESMDSLAFLNLNEELEPSLDTWNESEKIASHSRSNSLGLRVHSRNNSLQMSVNDGLRVHSRNNSLQMLDSLGPRVHSRNNSLQLSLNDDFGLDSSQNVFSQSRTDSFGSNSFGSIRPYTDDRGIANFDADSINSHLQDHWQQVVQTAQNKNAVDPFRFSASDMNFNSSDLSLSAEVKYENPTDPVASFDLFDESNSGRRSFVEPGYSPTASFSPRESSLGLEDSFQHDEPSQPQNNPASPSLPLEFSNPTYPTFDSDNPRASVSSLQHFQPERDAVEPDNGPPGSEKDSTHSTKQSFKTNQDPSRSISSRPKARTPKAPEANNLAHTSLMRSISGRSGCKCAKSQCLIMYCECFQHQVYCTEACRCTKCKNIKAFDSTRIPVVQQLLSKDPEVFVKARNSEKKGCTCAKTKCLLKYCQCFQAGMGCQDKCDCSNCQNSFGKKGEYKPMNQRPSQERLSEISWGPLPISFPPPPQDLNYRQTGQLQEVKSWKSPKAIAATKQSRSHLLHQQIQKSQLAMQQMKSVGPRNALSQLSLVDEAPKINRKRRQISYIPDGAEKLDYISPLNATSQPRPNTAPSQYVLSQSPTAAAAYQHQAGQLNRQDPLFQNPALAVFLPSHLRPTMTQQYDEKRGRISGVGNSINQHANLSYNANQQR